MTKKPNPFSYRRGNVRPPVPTVHVVVTDTNILINLAHVNLLDLLGKLAPYSFVMPEQDDTPEDACAPVMVRAVIKM